MAADEAVTAAAWADAETRYADRSVKVSDIAKSLGLSAIQLSNAAKTRGWPLRTSPRLAAGSAKRSGQAQSRATPRDAAGSTKDDRNAPAKTTLRVAAGATRDGRSAPAKTTPRVAAGSTKESRNAPAKRSQSKTTKPIVLVQRLYTAIGSELSKLEQQDGVSSQDRERASRALSQITNSLEKAVEMQREMTKALTKRSGAKHKEALAHAEDLRREIAERLERLQRQRTAGNRSGGAE